MRQGSSTGTHAPIRPDGVLEQPRTDSILNLSNRIPKLLNYSLTLESINGIGVSGGGHNNERHDGC